MSFLNKDISFDIPLICRKLLTHADKGHLEGSMSQNFDLGSTFYSMHFRKKKVLKNEQKLSVF